VGGDTITLNTGTAGVFSETITLAATSTNASGYAGALTAETLTVTGTVVASPAPAITAPGSVVLGVNQTATINPVSLSQGSVVAGETFTVTLGDTFGTLSVNTAGVTVTGEGSSALTIGGDLAAVNTALASLTDTSAHTGADALTVGAANSLGDVGTAQTVAVTVNSAPVLAAPAPQVIGVNQTATLGAIGLTESGNTAGETFTVTLADTNGVLAAAQAGNDTVSTAGSTITVSGTLADVLLSLGKVTDTNATTGADNITLTAHDSLGNSAVAQSASVTVNGLPVLTVPASQVITQGQATGLGAIGLTESGNTTGETFTVTLADTNGVLAAAQSGSDSVSASGTTITVSGSLTDVVASLGAVSDTNATSGTDSIAVSAKDSFNNLAIPQTLTVTVNPPIGQTYYLTAGVDTVLGGPGNNTVDAATNTLSSGDSIDGGSGGANILALTGGGLFNLKAPTTLTNIQTITAQEGQALFVSGSSVIAAQNQIVYLRDGLDATVNTTAATLNGANPRAATLTIIGAHNAAIINLASGNDAVLVGDARETVHGGTGNDTILVSAATIGATIDGGTGKSTLDVTGGGTVTMGASITNITTVLLAAAPGNMVFTSNAETGLTVVDQSKGADSITAGGAGQTLSGGNGTDTFNAAAAGGTTFKNLAAVFNGDTIGGFAGGTGNTIDITDINHSLGGFLFTFTENGTNTAGTMSVTDGTRSASLTLNGNFVSTDFHTAAFGANGTSITYSALPA